MPGSVSIKDDVGEKAEEKAITETFDKDSEAFKNTKPIEKKLLEQVWKDLAVRISKDQPDLGSTLASGLPKIGAEFVLEFEVKNAIQKDKLDNQRTDLVPIIREKLENRFVNLKVVVNPEKVEVVKPATPTEKLLRLAGKNPVVMDLQKRFGLEPNY